MPVRVVHVMPQIGIGGAETQLYALIVNSDPARISHEVIYYADSYDVEGLRMFGEAGIRLRRVPRNKRRPLRFLGDLAAAIRERSPDIVQCWLYSGTIWGRWAALRARARHVVVTYRSSGLIRVRALRVSEWLTSRRVHYLANSRACARAIAGQLGVPVERFHVIYNGFDLTAFDVPPNRTRLLREAQLPDDGRIVVTVGRLTAAKNHEMLLRLASLCKNRLPVRFVIVGHGEREAELKAMADRLGVRDLVRFLGLRKDIPWILRSADVFCFTSLLEGFPNALLEAMAAGLPIITTRFGAADELIDDGVNGTIVEINDVDAAFRALEAYLDDAPRAKRFAERARQTAAERFTMGAMVRETVDYYESLLENRKCV